MADASTTLPPQIDALARTEGRNGKPQQSAVSFPELVWAHFLRYKEVHGKKNLHGPMEAEYRRRLAAFEEAEGELIGAYWCTTEASAVAITRKQQTERGLARLRPQPADIRFHAAVDWVARDYPEIANVLHTCETLAVRVREVLGGTSERIAMQWILAVAGHLLGFVDDRDREGRHRDRKVEEKLVARKRNELAKVEQYYLRAGEKHGRLVYFWGMMSGVIAVALLGAAAALLLWWWTGFDPDDATTQYLFASYAMGAVGAIVSVMTRMGSETSFHIDFEVGRRALHRLGSFRPVIGAVSALVVFFAMKADLFQVLPEQQRESVYLYAVVAFIAGFSERWTNVIFGKAEQLLTGAEEEAPPEEPAAKPVPEERTASV
jgi:hypothetical protein